MSTKPDIAGDSFGLSLPESVSPERNGLLNDLDDEKQLFGYERIDCDAAR